LGGRNDRVIGPTDVNNLRLATQDVESCVMSASTVAPVISQRSLSSDHHLDGASVMIDKYPTAKRTT
jgi:hypothetical protein